MDTEDINFDPIPRIWRFHALYLLVCLGMGAAIFPFKSSISFFFLAGFCLVGVLLSAFGEERGAHILAASIGLATPIVYFGSLVPVQTFLALGILALIFYVFRKLAF
jgi:hypothetical protein